MKISIGGRGLGKTRGLINKLEEELKHKDSIIENERWTKEFYHDCYRRGLHENRCFKNEIDGLNRVIEEIDKENKEIKNKFDGLSELYEVKKKASNYWFDRYTLTQEELNRLSIEKKELVNSIEKLKFERDMDLHSLEIMKNTISLSEERIGELEWLNNVFSVIIKECCQSEDKIIIQYLDNKLNLLIDQNAPECMKTLLQNLIDELKS